LTNQDSAGGENFTVLTSINLTGKARKGIEIRQLFSLEMALNIHEKGSAIPKTYQIAKVKNRKHFVSASFSFGVKNRLPVFGMATFS